MEKNILDEIDKLIEAKKISEAEFAISKLGPEYFKNIDYLFLRSKIFFSNKLYYVAIDTLLIATEFEKVDKIYQFLSKIYGILGNKDLSEKISNPNLRIQAVNSLKKELTGISQKS